MMIIIKDKKQNKTSHPRLIKTTDDFDLRICILNKYSYFNSNVYIILIHFKIRNFYNQINSIYVLKYSYIVK